MNVPPPGWHPDPNDRRYLRWWTGTDWGEQVQPMPPQEPSRAPLLVAFLLPLIGFIWSIVLFARRENGLAVGTLLMVFVGTVVWSVVLLAAGGY